jgi:hypothetical protein
MKKQVYITGLLFIFLTLTLTSCKKDQLAASVGDLIIGKWKMKIERQVYLSDNVKEFEYIYYYKTDELAYEFTDGGSIFQFQNGDLYATSTFTLNDNLLIIENGDTDIEWANVAVNGDTLTWEGTGTYTDPDTDITYNVEFYFTATRSSK